MPATSLKQKKFMDAAAHNPAFAKQAGIPQKTAKDFSSASKGMKFGAKTRADSQKVNNPKTNQGKQELFKEGGTMATKMNPGFMAMIAKKKAGAKSAMPSKMGKPVMKKGMDTAKNGMKMAKGGTTSNRVVSKKELEESGLSLRDFLNKEKGLTRKAPEGMTREYKPRDASSQESKKSMSAEAGTSRGSRNFAGAGRGESGASADMLSRFNAGKQGYDEAGNAMKRGGLTSAKMGKVPSGGVKGKGEHAVQKSGISKGTMVKMSGSKPLGMKRGGKTYC